MVDVALNHPTDLGAWQRWQDGQRPLRAVRKRLLDRGPARGVLTVGGERPELLVAVDATTPSQLAALLAPVAHLDHSRVAVLAPHDLVDRLPGHGWTSGPWSAAVLDQRLDTVRVVLAAGHFLPLGTAGHVLARTRGLPFLAAQHGLLTPHAPPLAPGSTLLAWSEADAAFWRSGRDDVRTHVVGSQLLWRAAAAAGGDGDVPREPDAAPTYLGQLHGAELSREVLAAAAERFCRETGASYRPHPAERDRRSRRQHARWQAEGIRVVRGGPPLRELGTPVVSVFSTGVLEAAARGVTAWVELPDPPQWLREFWDRYDMRPWGGDPTPAPALPATAPSRRVAEIVEELL